MDAFKEFQGKDLDSAIEEACEYFNVNRTQLEIEIIRDAKSGIFGIVGTRKAAIRARRVHLVPQNTFAQDMKIGIGVQRNIESRKEPDQESIKGSVCGELEQLAPKASAKHKQDVDESLHDGGGTFGLVKKNMFAKQSQPKKEFQYREFREGQHTAENAQNEEPEKGYSRFSNKNDRNKRLLPQKRHGGGQFQKGKRSISFFSDVQPTPPKNFEEIPYDLAYDGAIVRQDSIEQLSDDMMPPRVEEKSVAAHQRETEPRVLQKTPRAKSRSSRSKGRFKENAPLKQNPAAQPTREEKPFLQPARKESPSRKSRAQAKSSAMAEAQQYNSRVVKGEQFKDAQFNDSQFFEQAPDAVQFTANTISSFDLPDTPYDFAELPDEIPEGLPLISREQITSPEFRQMLENILQNLIEPILGFRVELQFEFFKNSVRVHIDSGESSGLLIGREGQTLLAIQYLTSRILTHKLGAAVRLQLDAGEYRQRQEDKLQEIALALAERARKTGRSFSTRPLSSYHRRIIYLSLQESHDIQTRSIGDGSMKRVIIMCKRHNGEERDETHI